MIKRIAVLGTLLSFLTLPVAATLPLAVAAPPPAPAPAPKGTGTTPAISWNQLGLSNDIQLVGTNQNTDIGVPVPQGVVPTVLTGQIGSVVNLRNGRVDVLDARQVYLGSIAAPSNLTTTRFSINIAPAQVVDGIAKLSFVLRDDSPPADSCSQPSSVSLSDLANTYSGPTPNPRTVADFLPGYLDQIVIRVGPNPSHDQQQAALDLVAKLTHLYRPMPVRIDVDTTANPLTPAPAGVSRRVIEVRDGGEPALKVVGADTPLALLALSGSGAGLLQQVDLFADRRIKLAQSPTASVTSAQDIERPSTESMTFGELGMTGRVTVQGTTTLYTGFDADAFSVGSIDTAKVHLLAKYTPVVGGDATVLLRSGSAIMASHVLDNSGQLDISADIPADAIRSNVGMALEIRYVPKQQCAPLSDRITFELDSGSTVTVVPGMNNRGGFPILPMSFTPDFNVTVDSADQIRWAAQAINLMGQQSTVVMRPNVTTFDEAAKSGTALLTVATGDELAKAGMAPPLLPKQGETVAINGAPITDVDLNGPIGAVQAFSNNGRMVLAITHTGDLSLVDRSFDYIRSLDGRFSSLSGDVVATGASGDSLNLTLREGGPMPHQPNPGEGWKWWAISTIAIGAIVIVGVAAALLIRRRRRTVG
ncbi:hypothetical protein [Mycolicibacterium komossense]|uniref:Uncharacterized protein n=1 Tax=Mycolicibacterium komossense TaxID=1779 RepID=A0ABT3CL12_9MYCO|nr:hypothetical protein [Mycolicibacterium komossense]MCV7230147.1 hypothetical protein [Mycolicibacterium komossense]